MTHFLDLVTPVTPPPVRGAVRQHLCKDDETVAKVIVPEPKPRTVKHLYPSIQKLKDERLERVQECLVYIRRCNWPGACNSELCREFNLSQPAITGYIAELVGRGLIYFARKRGHVDYYCATHSKENVA